MKFTIFEIIFARRSISLLHFFIFISIAIVITTHPFVLILHRQILSSMKHMEDIQFHGIKYMKIMISMEMSVERVHQLKTQWPLQFYISWFSITNLHKSKDDEEEDIMLLLL